MWVLADIINKWTKQIFIENFTKHQRICFFFSPPREIFSKIGHIPGSKTTDFHEMQENLNSILQSIWSPQIKGRYKQQQKAYNLLETKNLPTESKMDQDRN